MAKTLREVKLTRTEQGMMCCVLAEHIAALNQDMQSRPGAYLHADRDTIRALASYVEQLRILGDRLLPAEREASEQKGGTAG